MSVRALLEIWSLSFSDFEFLETYHQGSRIWIGGQLLYFRNHGHFTRDLANIPDDAQTYVGDQLGLYSQRLTVSQRIPFVATSLRSCTTLGFTGQRSVIVDPARLALIGAWRASSFEDWAVSGYRWSPQHSVFIPSDKIMGRIVRSARKAFRDALFKQVAERLSQDTTSALDACLSDPLLPTGFQRWKDDIGDASP
ncbi:hypothetical protein AB9F29_18190 [Falsihalocynthiibacter sp. S25ZX9]|uniref:hypothetical protein n=1 Tax=Falsihalocynthiibacter sp. S25ZX9 TaxID=3240870 RepID=UPI00350FA642